MPLPVPAPLSARETNRTRVMTDGMLTAKHRLVVEYMVHGVPHGTLLARLPLRYVDAGTDPETGEKVQRLTRPGANEPLSIEDAGMVCNLRPRLVRSLARQAAFQRLLATETAALRDGARIRAVQRMVRLVDEPGAGKAADRKVQLAASLAVLGEGGSASVTINNTVGVALAPGYIIDLSEPDEPAARTVDHAA